MNDNSTQWIEAATRELLDKERIRELLYTCCRALDRCDLELLKSVYHSDGFVAHGPAFVGNAHDFCTWVIPRLRGHRLIRHTVGNLLIDLRDDEAFCESYYQVSIRTSLPDGRVVDTLSEGRYLDVLRRQESTWRIFHRLVINDKRWTKPVEAQDMTENQAVLEGLTPRNDSHDLVYRNFGVSGVRPPKAGGPQ